MRVQSAMNRTAGIRFPGTVCNNYRRISLLSTSYNILRNVLLSRLSAYIRVDELIGDPT
jgi:hypothetical protein